jgi:hypothetical protein
MPRQKFPATAVAATLALLTTGEHAIAQGASEMEVRLEAGAARTSAAGQVLPMGSMAALTPGLRFANRRFAVDTRGSAWLNGQTWQLGDVAVATETRSATWRGIRAEFLANASRLVVTPGAVSNQVDAGGRLHLIRENAGAWVGTGVIRPLRIATVANTAVSSGGVWAKFGPTTWRATVTNVFFTRYATNDTAASSVAACPTASQVTAQDVGPGSLTIPSTASAPSCRRESRLTDIEGGVRYERPLFELSLRGGQRFGKRIDVTPSSRVWGSAQAAVWVSSQLAVVSAGGREPAQPTRGLPARAFASLGMMLAYWPIPRGTVLVESPINLVRAFEHRPAGEALQRLTARIGGVERVEVMGDFTDWAPVPLVRRGRDSWELLASMGPGVHQINMRIDGGKWFAPPGVPSIKDDFSGEVGVLVIKQ